MKSENNVQEALDDWIPPAMQRRIVAGKHRSQAFWQGPAKQAKSLFCFGHAVSDFSGENLGKTVLSS